MDRALSEAERAVVEAMITSGVVSPGEPAPTLAQRQRWLNMVEQTSVCGACDCGLCPSVELAYPGNPVDSDAPRLVLSADTKDGKAMVMLFIDGGLLSYLEVAPLNDCAHTVAMPAPADLLYQ